MGRWYYAAAALAMLLWPLKGCGSPDPVPFKPVSADQVPSQLVVWAHQDHDARTSLAVITTADRYNNHHAYIAIHAGRCNSSTPVLKLTQVKGNGLVALLSAKKYSPQTKMPDTFWELNWPWAFPQTPVMTVHKHDIIFRTEHYVRYPTDEVQVYYGDTDVCQ